MAKYTKKRHVRRTRKNGRRKSQKGSGNTPSGLRHPHPNKIGPEWARVKDQVLPRKNSMRVLPEGAENSPHKIGRSTQVHDLSTKTRSAKEQDMKLPKYNPRKRPGHY